MDSNAIQLGSDDIAEDQVEEETSTSMQSNKVTDSSSTECTNEEELNLYLKSMETIFVKQLQKSLDLFADHQSLNPSCKHKTASSGQFKVLREGHWSRVDFRKRVDSFEDPKCLLANPWIRRYNTNCYDHQNEIIKSPASSSRETIPLATLAQKFQSWREDSATTSSSNNTEVMGQNFDDDEAADDEDEQQQLEEEE